MILFLFSYFFLSFSVDVNIFVSSDGKTVDGCSSVEIPCPTIGDAVQSALSNDEGDDFSFNVSIFNNHTYSFITPNNSTNSGKNISVFSFCGIRNRDQFAYVPLILTSPVSFKNTLSFDRINFVLYSSSFDYLNEYVFQTISSLIFSSVSFIGEDSSQNGQITTINKTLVNILNGGSVLIENSIFTGITFSLAPTTAVVVNAGGSAKIIGSSFFNIVHSLGNGGAINAVIISNSSLLLLGVHFSGVSVLPALYQNESFAELGKGGGMYVELGLGGSFVTSGVDTNPSVFNLCSADVGGGIYLKLQDDFAVPDSTTAFFFESNTTLKFLRCTASHYAKHIFVETPHRLELFVNNRTFDYETYNAAFLTDPYALMGVSEGRTTDVIPLYRYILDNPCITAVDAGGVCPHGCFHGIHGDCVLQCSDGQHALDSKCEVIPNTFLTKIFNKANLYWLIVTGTLILVVVVLFIIIVCLCCRRKEQVKEEKEDLDGSLLASY